MKNSPITIKFAHNIEELKALDFVNQWPYPFWIVFKFKASVTYYLHISKIKFSLNYVSFIANTKESVLVNGVKGFKDLNGSIGIVNKKYIKIEEDSALDEIQVFRHLPSTILKRLFKQAHFENKEIKKELNNWNKCLDYNNKTIDVLNNLYITNQIRKTR
jgi:hypothetical protein